jgi:hypothetical protein
MRIRISKGFDVWDFYIILLQIFVLIAKDMPLLWILGYCIVNMASSNELPFSSFKEAENIITGKALNDR